MKTKFQNQFQNQYWSFIPTAFAVAVLILLLQFQISSAQESPEFHPLVEIASVSPGFAANLETILKNSAKSPTESPMESPTESPAKSPTESPAEKSAGGIHDSSVPGLISTWIKENKFPRIKEFLDSLSLKDVETLFAYFQKGKSPVSEEFCPIVEALVVEAPAFSGQETVLTFPFSGEFFVVQGNQGWVSHLKNTNNEWAWDFVVMKNGSMSKDNAGKNKNYHAWGMPLLSPAPGIVRKVVDGNEDHPPLTTKLNKANYVLIEHLNGEVSNLHHIMKGSIVVKVGDIVDRGMKVALIGDTGISMFPHLHYQIDRGGLDKHQPLRAVFSCYFARRKTESTWRLVISGSPEEGEHVIGVGDYLDFVKQAKSGNE